jgi:alcohol dehydrogenase (cytochrome c)
MHGDFRALDARTGKILWSSNLGSGIGPGAASYSVNGKQYIAIVVGRTAAIPAFLGADVGGRLTSATPEGGAMFVFSE